MIVEVDFTKNIAEKHICECCVMRRQKTIFYDSLIESETQPNEFVYSDLVESLSPTEFNDCRYFVTFKNDFISYSEVYCIRYKSETFVMFLRFKVFLESRSYKICRIRLDNKIDFIAYALKRIQKKLVNKSEKYILLGYKGEFIFRLYNLIKKKIIRVNNIYFVEKRLLIINFEEKTNDYKFSIKR